MCILLPISRISKSLHLLLMYSFECYCGDSVCMLKLCYL